MKELIAMVGLPRSGKSYCVDNELYTHHIICTDDIRLALGTQFESKIEPFVWAIHDTMIRALMIREKDIVLDETNTTLTRIEKYYSFCKQYNYSFRLLYIKTPIEECLKRNIGLGSVPEEVIYKMNDQLQNMLFELKEHPLNKYLTIN
ncbi:MAG: AAA family ATPase [Thermotogota bacterium]|nr:AAA family ATPase [Thermotogota bacterium]